MGMLGSLQPIESFAQQRGFACLVSAPPATTTVCSPCTPTLTNPYPTTCRYSPRWLKAPGAPSPANTTSGVYSTWARGSFKAIPTAPRANTGA